MSDFHCWTRLKKQLFLLSPFTQHRSRMSFGGSFFLSNIKSYRDKVLKHYDLLDYNTKTEPRGVQNFSVLGLNLGGSFY